MTPERMAALVARWVELYTRNLPPDVAERRRDEIDADLHDHIAHERAHGTRERRITLSIGARMVRGLPADASWRRRMSRGVSRSVMRVVLAMALVLLPVGALQIAGASDWSLADFVLAAALIAGTGTLLELAAKRPRNVVYRPAAIAIGVAAMALGEADDAPGLVLFGCLLIAGTVALALRTAQRSE